MRELRPVGVRRLTLTVSAVVMTAGGAGSPRRLPVQQGTGVRHPRGAGTSVAGNAEHPAEFRLLFNQGSRAAIVGTTAGAVGKTGASFTPAHRTAVFPSAEAAPSHRRLT